jgi:hypothetical protein
MARQFFFGLRRLRQSLCRAFGRAFATAVEVQTKIDRPKRQKGQYDVTPEQAVNPSYESNQSKNGRQHALL